MNLLLIGIVGLIIVYVLSSGARKRRKTRARLSFTYLYIVIMALVFYALFVAHDPFELPPIANEIITYAIIVGSLIGFYRQIEGNMRTDFNNRIESLKTDLCNRIDSLRKDSSERLTEIKADFQREIDKLEKRIN
jgi:hypothetical protein